MPRQLARWVITQALRDAGVGSDHAPKELSQLVTGEARSFLLSSSGEWKRSREFWCLLADLNADELRQRSMRLLGLEKEPEPPPVKPPPAPKPPPPRGPRPGTKLALLIERLASPEGISLADMMDEFGWSRVTCSTAVSSDLPYKFGIRSKRGPDKCYRIVEAA